MPALPAVESGFMVSLDPDVIIDRRRIKRRLSLWRFVAVVSVIAAAIAAVQVFSDSGIPFARKSHIAAIDITGLITGKRKRVEMLREIKESKAAKALIVRIDSPGGSTAGSEIIYEELAQIAAEKPVVAVMKSVAASGGYLIAMAAEHVIARGNTITGSIGVYVQWARVDEALASLGIEVDQIKSGPLKAEPDLFGVTSPLARSVTRKMIQDSQDWFVSLVADNRPINITRVHVLADGRVYTGRQALEAELIDEIGGEREARAWLVANKGLSEDLKIEEWKIESSSSLPVGVKIVSSAAALLGIPIDTQFGLESVVSSQRLDGLLSLWHPDLLR